MTVSEIYKRFPTHDICMEHLESLLWPRGPVCPYCRSTNSTPAKGTRRRHCNNCNTSYSITVGTMFHHTRLDLQRWFAAVPRVVDAPFDCSARTLARDIAVTKDTAWRMLARIRNALPEARALSESLTAAAANHVPTKKRTK